MTVAAMIAEKPPRAAPLWLLALLTFSGTLAMHVFVPALPEAGRDLGASIGEMQMTMSVYIFGLAVGQLLYGPLSDRFGRKELIAGGMIVQAAGIWLTVLVPAYGAWLLAAALQGLGTAMVYPTLLAAITDHAHPTWRATSLGVYRFWRDLGYAIGALLSGIVADLVGLAAAIHLVAALTLISGLVVVRAMRKPTPSPVGVVA